MRNLKAKLSSIPTSTLALLVSAMVVAAAGVIMSQTFPSVTVQEALKANCSPLIPSDDPILANSSGFETFDCGTAAAFGVDLAMGYTPTFSLAGTDYTDVYVYPSTSPTTVSACAAITGAQALAPGTPVSLAVGTYSYCADYASATAPDLGSFTISWSA